MLHTSYPHYTLDFFLEIMEGFPRPWFHENISDEHFHEYHNYESIRESIILFENM